MGADGISPRSDASTCFNTTSYYGVSNTHFAANLGKRIEQIGILLQGHHFWYLGEVYANPAARWALAGLLAAVTLLGLEVYLAFEAPKPGQDDLPAPAWLQRISASAPLLWRRVLGLMLLAGLIVVQSCFTVSDLFITHFALLLPLLPLLGAAAADLLAQHGRRPALLAFAALLVWGGPGRKQTSQRQEELWAQEAEVSEGPLRLSNRPQHGDSRQRR